jgi:hypothetical protein
MSQTLEGDPAVERGDRKRQLDTFKMDKVCWPERLVLEPGPSPKQLDLWLVLRDEEILLK